MKSRSKWLSLIVALVILSIPFLYALSVYDNLPETIATHFDIEGKPNGFGPKSSIYLGPIILGIAGLLVFLLLQNITRIDPKKTKGTDPALFGKIGYLMVVFMSVLGLVIVYSSVQPGNFFMKYLFSLMGLMFAALGYIFPSIKPNYFVGFRIPWTLENEENWTATHQMAGKWWMYGGILQVILGILLAPEYVLISFFIIMAVMVAVPTRFSYQYFKKHSD